MKWFLPLLLVAANSALAVQPKPTFQYPCPIEHDDLAAKICDPLSPSVDPLYPPSFDFVAASNGAVYSQLYIDHIKTATWFGNGEYQTVLVLPTGTHRLSWKATDKNGKHKMAVRYVTVE